MNDDESGPSRAITLLWASCYVFSGICQPMIMTLCKEAGLANSKAQLYMFFYYLGPAGLIVTLIGDKYQAIPPRSAVLKASLIAVYDILAQSLNYTGAGLAGPTLFAIIYSSVTIWAAVFSRLFIGRSISWGQWMAVLAVSVGLSVTGIDSVAIGPDILRGTLLVAVGSMMHGSAYVLNEAIMTVTTERLSVRQNSAIQGTVACLWLGVWQLGYTRSHYEELIGEPMEKAGTSFGMAALIMAAFAFANLLHSLTFSHTLKYYPGGATSAGVMKGLQAVLVFVAAWALYCGRIGGQEMCFSTAKVVSLVSVYGGVTAFAILTEQKQQQQQNGRSTAGSKGGYERIDEAVADDHDLALEITV